MSRAGSSFCRYRAKEQYFPGIKLVLRIAGPTADFIKRASAVRWKLYMALAVVLTLVPPGDCALADSSLLGTCTICRGAPTWAKSSRSENIMNSVQKGYLKLIF